MKYLKLILLFSSFFLFISCNNDNEDNTDCGKDIYHPMENNPTKTEKWLIKLIESRENRNSSISLYKWNDKNCYYILNLPSNKEKSSSDQEIGQHDIYDIDGRLNFSYGSFSSEEDFMLFKEFHENSTCIITLWRYIRCWDKGEYYY